MMQIDIVGSKNPLLVIRIDSPMSDEDHRRLSQAIEKAAAAGLVRLVVALSDYPSLNSAEDLMDDLKFLMLHAGRISKAAVVSDRAAQETFVGLFALFSGLSIEWFEASQIEAAVSWAQGD